MGTAGVHWGMMTFQLPVYFLIMRKVFFNNVLDNIVKQQKDFILETNLLNKKGDPRLFSTVLLDYSPQKNSTWLQDRIVFSRSKRIYFHQHT